MAAFALNVTPHEAVHAAVGYLLGFSSTLFQMWVNPDAATASSRQMAAIAALSWERSLGCSSKWRYRDRAVGLVFLMLGIIGIYPLAGAAFGGDFNIVPKAIGASKIIQNAASATGLVLLPLFMFFMGKELSWWSPLSFGRTKAVVCTTCEFQHRQGPI